MKEATRQMVLLIGVMSILTAGLVAINSAGNESKTPPEPSQEAGEAANDTRDNMSGEGNREEVSEETGDSNSTSLIAQSINGWKQLWKDIKAGQEAILGSEDSDS